MTPGTQLAFLNVAHFLCHYFLLIFPTAVIAIAADWGLSYGAALALGTPLYVIFALATLPAGWLGDHWDGQRLIGLSFFGLGAASLFIAFAADDLWLMVGLGALGLFAAIYHPVGLAMVTRLSDRPGHALAVNGVYGNLGLAAAALATGLLADAFGWRSAFLVPGLVVLVVGLVHLMTVRRHDASARPSHQAKGPDTVAVPRAIQIRVVAVILLAALFSGVIFNGVTISLPKLFDERLGAIAPTLTGVGGYTTLVFAVAAFAQLPVGNLLDRVGGRPVMIALYVLIAATLALLSQAFGWLAVPGALVVVTFMFAGLPITGWLLGRYVASSWRSRAFAAEYVLSLGMASAIVPAIALLHENGYGFDSQYLLFALSAGVVVLGAAALPRAATLMRASLQAKATISPPAPAPSSRT